MSVTNLKNPNYFHKMPTFPDGRLPSFEKSSAKGGFHVQSRSKRCFFTIPIAKLHRQYLRFR